MLSNVQNKLLLSTYKPSTLIWQSIMDKHWIIKDTHREKPP